jgi:hypothetical protein
MLCVLGYLVFERAGFIGGLSGCGLFARGVGHLGFLVVEEGKVLCRLVLWERD